MRKILDWVRDTAASLLPTVAPAADAIELVRTPVSVLPADSVVKGPQHHFPFAQRLERLFVERSAGWIDRIAVIDEPQAGAVRQLSYGALRQRVAVLVRHLQQLGVQPGQVVGVHLDRSADLVTSVLAIWTMGAVYLPLDRAFPPAYLASLCGIAQPSVLLTGELGAADIGCTGLPQLSLAALDFSSKGVDFATMPTYAADAPALIMFTSGSTGQPKGVRHSQLQLINRFHWMWHDYPFRDGDVIAQRSPMNVMPSMWELLGGVLSGISTAIVPDRIVREPGELFAWLALQNVTHLTLTPQLIKLLLDLKQNGARHPGCLRRVINGGPLSASLQQRFLREFPATVLLHDFGCTETNTYLHEAMGGPEACGVAGQGGYRPIANTTIYLLDAGGRAVARGVEGEVYIAGPSLAIDYLGPLELSAERFISAGPDGLARTGRLFRTGEMACMLPNGALRMTGRYDSQAKVSGLRVEVEHVELVLGDHPAVAEVAVLAHPMSELHTRLVVFWVPRPGRFVAPQQLRDFLATRLPAHMVPGAYSTLVALPRRPNGKIDRVGLQQQLGAATPAMPARVQQSTEPALAAVVAELLGMDSSQVDPRCEFNSLGLDSAMLMSFATSAALLTGLDVPVSSCFNYPSIALLAQHLDSIASVQSRSAVASATVQASPAAPASPAILAPLPLLATSQPVGVAQDAIAIIGISLRVPGADDRHAFWHNLEQGVESVGPIPAERWDGEAYYHADLATPGRSNSKWGGFMRGIDQFEPLFFNLSPKEAAAMDPQQRLCLMESWRALEDAGYAPDAIGHRQVGVFVGAREPDYAGLSARQGQLPSAATLLGSDMSLIAARISYFLNLNGPSLVVDTACSSSMTALHLACQSLRSGETELALAGGICLTLDPEFYVASSKLGIFSPTGRCRAFDAAADGFVHGEGVAFTVLKPLQAALRDGDHVYAVVRGTALNQDGRSNGITAPNGLAQTRLQQDLYQRLDIDPASIGYVEAHGTGTALGDVVEVQALARTFRVSTSQSKSCAIGSVKPNIGHLTTAAGMMGVIKAALCLHHAKLVPSINYVQPNPRIDFANTPFYVNTVVQDWPEVPGGGMRRAAINSFGIGGTNGHCVLEQAAMPTPQAVQQHRWHLVPITAHTPAAVKERLRDLSAWLQGSGGNEPVYALAYTLSCGRSRFDNGYLLAFQNVAELGHTIDLILAGEQTPNSWSLTGRRNATPALLDEAGQLWSRLACGVNRSELDQLAGLIVQGYWPQWEQWFSRAERRRIALPVYPFQTERCWLSAATISPKPERAALPIAPTYGAEVVTAVAPVLAAAEIAPRQDSASPALLAAVLAILGAELGLDAADIDPHTPLSDYGMESVKAINVRFMLEGQLNVDLSIQDIVGAGTAASLAGHVRNAGGDNNPAMLMPAPASPDFTHQALLEPSGGDKLSQASEEQLIALFQQLSSNSDHSFSHAN